MAIVLGLLAAVCSNEYAKAELAERRGPSIHIHFAVAFAMWSLIQYLQDIGRDNYREQRMYAKHLGW